MHKKTKKRLPYLLFVIVFMLSFSVSTSFFTSLLNSNYNNLDNVVDLETTSDDINKLFNGKSYPFELTDVYDDANSTKIYTSAYLQTEIFNNTISDWNGTAIEDEVSVVNNTNYKSPFDTGVTMINGTFDDTDNMRANDGSNTEFTSAGGGVGLIYVDPDGDGTCQWTTDGSDNHWENVDNGVREPANPGTGDKNRVGLGDNNKIDTYTFETDTVGAISQIVLWHYGRASTGEDCFNQIYIDGGWTSYVLCGFAGTAWKSRTFNGDWDQGDLDDLQVRYKADSNYGEYDYTYLYAVYCKIVYTEPTKLNFTIDLDFNEVDTSKLLALDVSSHHFTNVSTDIIGNIYDYDSSSYTQMFSSNNEAETENNFTDESSVDDYLDGSGNLRLYFTGIGSSFKLLIDYIRVRFYYKMDIIIYKSFSINGFWRYRFKIIGSLHYTDWIVFEVIDPIPNFYAISESDLTTRWILQGAEISAVEDFHDDINTDYWNLVDVSDDNIIFNTYPTDDSYTCDGFSGTNYGNEDYLWVSDSFGGYIIYTFIRQSIPYLTLNYSANSDLYMFAREILYEDIKVNISKTSAFDEGTITWNNQPEFGDFIMQTGLISEGNGYHFDVGAPTENYIINFADPLGVNYLVRFGSSEAINSVHKPIITHNLQKNYFDSGYMYMQTNTTESLALLSQDYTTHYNLSSGDYFEIDFQTSSDSKIDLVLLKDGGINKTLTLSQSGNTNFDRHTAKISIDEFVEFDQLKISSTFEDKDNVKVHDIKTYKYTLTGDSADFCVGSKRDYEVYLTPDTYNLRIFEEGDEKINTNITIPTTGVLQHVYTPAETLECRLALFNTIDESLEFTDYHIQVNRSLNGIYNDFELLESIFSVDIDTYVYINVSDRFDTLIATFERLASNYIDLELEVYVLQIKNLMEQKTTIDINVTHVYPLLSGESIYFMLSKAHYQIGFYDEYDSYTDFTIHLISNQAYQLNSSLKTIYFSMFTYDGLGIDHDLVRFYINGERKDFGFNSMLEDSLELVILDFFNNTLANETIDANAYDNSEYNLYVQIYSMYILNQFTYNDLIFNITQVGSGYYMNQLIPSASALFYRFIPNLNYTINATYVNGTVYNIRTINLTDNSQIESFGVPSAPTEYPKDVYFGVYTTTGLGIDHDLLRFYIDGTISDFGFNRIEDMMITLTVKDFFNTTLFNQMINTSGIYEYNILITLYSLKVKNEARESTNYTLCYGALNTTGFILPEEIIEYQLSSNNYVFNYTNNEDDSFHAININLNQNRVYILNSTYYDIYFSLFDLNLHSINPSQYVFRLNGTREAFGFIADLQTDDYTITITDRFGTSLFDSVVSLRGLNEYMINITLYELQIRHLASENSDLVLIEDVSGNNYTFIMTPDSIKSIITGSADYTLNWTNGENSQLTSFSIALTTDRVVMLNSTYYDVYFSLYDQNGVRLDDSMFSLYLNGSRKDFGFVNLESANVLIVVQDYLNFTVFNSVITLSGFTEYNIIITVYELQIRHLAQENSNLTLYEGTTHNCINFSMSPDSLNKYMLSGSSYNITWVNGENRISTIYNITLNENYILTLNSSYYDIYFTLFDVNLHTIDSSLYEFRLNGTIYDFGLVMDLQTDDYTIVVTDQFGTSLFNNIITLRALNEYRIDITLYELQIRHLALENGNLTLSETTGHSSLDFNMAPDTIRYFILGSSTYNITWLNNENGITTTYDINLIVDYILTLNSSYYDIYFSLFDLNLHTIDPSQYEFRLNGTVQDFGFISDLQTDDYNITVTDRFGTSLFNNIIVLRGLNEYRIDVSLYELQIRHLGMENSNMSLYETTLHNGLNFSMAPDTIRSFILGSSTYNITWTNGENGIATTYDIALNSDYILTLNTTYYNIHFSLFDLNLHVIDSNQYEFRLNGTVQDFGLITNLQTDDYNITITDRFGTSLFSNIITLRGLNEYRIDINLYEIQIRHLARENSNLTLTEDILGNDYLFIMTPDSIKSIIVGSSDYTLNWTNGENGLTASISISLTEDRVVMLNSSYYDVFFSLFDLNLHTIDPNQYVFKLNGTIHDFGLVVDLQTDDYTITVVDRFGTSLFDSVVNLKGLNEYRIDVTLYELQIRHLAFENSNLTLCETTSHNSLNFSMSPNSLRSFVLGSSTYNVTWTNGENGISTTYDINLNENYILTLDSTYYSIYFSLFDLNLHTIDPCQYVFRLNGTIQDFGLIEQLSTNNYTITVVDRFGTSLFDSVVYLRGLNECRINISLHELQIRHLARENSNLTLTEDISGNNYTFIMTPDSIKSLVIGSADYTLGWTNGETGLIASISITLTEDRVVMLNSSYYDIYFSLFDVNLHTIDLNQYEFRLNGTIQDFGLVVDLQTDDYTITITDRFENSLFNNIIALRGLNEYRINITLYELQIRHLARENGNLTLSETTTHNSLNFTMSPDSLCSFILGSSTYNITWLNNENGITTTYDVNLNSDYILTLNTSYYDIFFSLFDLNLHTIDSSQYIFRLNGTIHDFGLIVDLQTDDYNISVVDRFGTSLFDNIVNLRDLNEYRIDITLYELQIRHLARVNGNMSLYETTTHNSLNFSMAPDTIRNFVLGSSTYNITWINGENGVSTLYNINLNSDYILTLNTTFYLIYFSLFDQYGVKLDDSLFSLYINATRKDFGFVELETNDVLILVQDYLNVTVFNQVVGLRGFAEYNIIVTVLELQIRHLGYENSNLTLYETTTHNCLNFSMAPDTIRCFMLADSTYNITWINGENGASTLYNIILDENYILLLESTYHTVYIGLFTYDGLGLNRDWVRLYINDVRADFGFNVIQSETANLTVLDYFNNTLASVIIDASAWSEYNIYVEVYSLYLLNQFTYTDLIMNITQVGSGYYMAQLIPSASALLYRFIPNLNYTIKATYLNGTIYNIRTINLTENSQTESFGVPSAPEEFPKYVWFGVYSFSEININPDLLRFYIDGNITNFGSNWITDAIITITVKDYFNTTLFNQVINVTGIYEYNIPITLYSLKVKNEARIATNYTLSYGALETTGFILPEEIIEYQLSSNNYVFDYTNNEDNSFHTININLNQDRVYILNTTFYTTYFSLYDQNGVRLDDSLFSLYINGSRKDFGFIELSSPDILIVVHDYLNFTAFNNVITLDGIAEYNIIITVYELQIRHLAQENSNLTLYETTTHNHIDFSMAPDTIRYFILADSTYNITWVNGENSVSTLYNITLDGNYILLLDSTYYSVYIGLYNFYGIVNHEEVKFYINGSRADFGFNTIKSEYVNLTVLDYFNSTLYNQTVRLEGLSEYSIFIHAYTLVVNNLYNDNTITIKITRGNITIERLIEAQGWTEFKLFANVTYEINSYINGTLDEEKSVLLDEEYKTVDFGFYSAEVSILPEPLDASVITFLIFMAILITFSFIVIIMWSYMKKRKDEVPKKVRRMYTEKKPWKPGTFQDKGT